MPFNHSNKLDLLGKPYDKVAVQGHELDNLTYAAFLVAQGSLDKDTDWTILQGSYTDANPSSGGTHAGGGALDISAFNWQERVRALRKVGFAAWHRPLNWDGQGGGEHIHAVLVGNQKLSIQAKAQIPQYLNYQDGLADAGPDKTWHPFDKGGEPPVFQYDLFRSEIQRVTHLAGLVGAAQDVLVKAKDVAQNDDQKANFADIVQKLGNVDPHFRYVPGQYVKTRGSQKVDAAFGEGQFGEGLFGQ